ncbi:Uncharacterised protein [Serratia grimesii]|nr:Uncharacterised protein [Serratia grimesii]CAI0894537.1 Uncharacterised protein [Serratia grimesii]CAI2444031.1 Uncharacterised protein [Serratia grimesii]SUI32704.1 Uncharacterised protein [Serratia grimesii]
MKLTTIDEISFYLSVGLKKLLQNIFLSFFISVVYLFFSVFFVVARTLEFQRRDLPLSDQMVESLLHTLATLSLMPLGRLVRSWITSIG